MGHPQLVGVEKRWIASLITCLALTLIAMSFTIPVQAAPYGIPEWAVISESHTWIGVPYKYGGTGRSGIDCSWLVYRVYSNAGKPYGAYYYYRTAENIKGASYPVYPPRPGDLILFQEKTTGRWTHVGIYMWQSYRNGRWDIYFVHASAYAGKVIGDYLLSSPYYGTGWWYRNFNIAFVRYNPDYWIT